MPHSLHSILRDVLDTSNGAIYIRFSGGGATDAHSVHSIARAVYDETNGAIYVTADTFTGAGTTGIVPDPGSETGKYLKDDGTWGTPSFPAPLSPIPDVFRDNTGNQAVAGTAVTVNLNTSKFSEAQYTLATNEIEFGTAGTYVVNYTVGFDLTNTTGYTRGTVSCWIEYDGTGSYVEDVDSRSKTYIREDCDETAVTGGTIIAVERNKKIRLRAQQTHSAFPNIDTAANEVNVRVYRVD